ncbi:site-specific integrase [Cohaesibacter marisflavi]|uniref:site-specific integrase n=1 Tax=Cohaesibacter marisflavi TaxID=655353 RepID=UPI0029C960E1|nr:site-specific integrase [Cohaesibacter marisflavi]
MSGHPRLYRRNATYYHRAVVPVDIQETYGKTEEKFSLKTKDYREALKLVRIAAVEVDQRFDEHRAKLALEAAPPTKELSDEQIKQFGDVAYHSWLYFDDWMRERGFGQSAGLSEEDVAKIFEDYRSGIDARMRLHKAHYARGQVRSIDEEIALDFLKDLMGIKLDPASPSLRKAVIENQKAVIRAQKAIAERAEGEVIETPPMPAVDKEPFAQSSVILLSDAVRDWAAEKAKTSWVAKTEREHRVWMQHFIETVGDRPLDDYTKADARAFKAALMQIPPNWSKHKPLQGITKLTEAAEKANKIGLAAMSDRNVNKILGFVGSFWTWAEGQYDETPANLFKGVKLKINKRARDDRDPFTMDELKAIFSAPVYTGCKSLREWNRPGDLVPRDAGIYWVPLISRFSGARMGEIIQLRVADVKEEGGIAYLSVNAEEEDQHLKNLNSWRLIPIHPKLIEMGFLKLVERRRAEKAERLFPDLKKGKDGYYSSPFSKHFNRFLRSVGAKRDKTSFHSFRHNFEDACRDNGVSKELMDALQGHGERGMSGGATARDTASSGSMRLCAG